MTNLPNVWREAIQRNSIVRVLRNALHIAKHCTPDDAETDERISILIGDLEAHDEALIHAAGWAFANARETIIANTGNHITSYAVHKNKKGQEVVAIDDASGSVTATLMEQINFYNQMVPEAKALVKTIEIKVTIK